MAIRRGEPWHDPEDAELLVELSRRADLARRANARRWRWHVPLAVVAAVIAIAAGQLAGPATRRRDPSSAVMMLG